VRYTRCCVASVRRWYPEIPITLLKDQTVRPYDTSELEHAWDVDLFEGDRPLPGGSWNKLEPLLLPGHERCLILDSDVVLLGRVIDALETVDANFVVESYGSRPEDLYRDGYFDPDALERLDPEFAYPGHTFNTGQFVATTGMLKRSDFEPLVRFGALPQPTHPEVFSPVEQGILNYVLMKKAQQGALTLARLPFMVWGFNRIPRRGPQAIPVRSLTLDSPHCRVMHWAGHRKRTCFLLMRNGRILRHFESCYYTRVPAGRRKRLMRSASLAWRGLTARHQRRATAMAGRETAP
jgi:hypothetical protein